MNQHASKNSVPPSVSVDVSRIETLLNRNLPEVFGEGDPARRRSAIQELYTEDCVLYVPPGTFVGHDALDKFAATGVRHAANGRPRCRHGQARHADDRQPHHPRSDCLSQHETGGVSRPK
jgi:hypothetical protein